MPTPLPALARRLSALLACAVLAADAQPSSAHGQAWSLNARADLVVTQASPGIGGTNVVEGYLTQPLLIARYAPAHGALRLAVTLDAERWTLRRGELTPGIWGEGYIDRRHPHTPLHELVGAIVHTQPQWSASLAAGKGFVAFGTDDPMDRPFEKFTANHHLQQLPERVFLGGALRWRMATAEWTGFGGDEPANSADQPNLRRFGDSWAARLTLIPRRSVEWQASFASVASPEDDVGRGQHHDKWSSSARWARGDHEVGAMRYLLAEWARTGVRYEGRTVFCYSSMLVEGVAAHGSWRAAARVERTFRPEEERLGNPFRTPYPHVEPAILGVTRWDIAGVRIERSPTSLGLLTALPFIEVFVAHPTEDLQPSVFVPRDFYGASRLWTLTAGLRLSSSQRRHRMGRYGVWDSHEP